MDNKQEMITNYKCQICGNSDIHSIGYLNGKPYCRRCISFKGEEVEHKPSYPKKAPIHLSYELSSEQKELSDMLVENYKKEIDSLVFAVCGSGKTEICLKVIEQCIKEGKTVGFAVPRKTVCFELGVRLSHIFIRNKVAVVCGGHHSKLDGDIICLTTHQLFRYKKFFDLLIMDEIDAYPYKGNGTLKHFFEESVRGRHILLSATPSKELIKEYSKNGKEVLRLASRFHRHPLPVPKIEIAQSIKLYYILLKEVRRFLKLKKQILIFVPTIDDSKNIAAFLKLFYLKGTYINSKRNNGEQVIEGFRNKRYMYLVSTAVLERGVTIKDVQVIIFHADHQIYDSAALIQIAGRVGRKKDAPEGEVIFIAKENTKHMQGAVSEICASNKILQDMLQKNQK